MATDVLPPSTTAGGLPPRSPVVTRPRAAVLGIVSVALTIAVAELLAAVASWTGLMSTSASPVRSLGQAFIDITPAWLSEWAKKTLGAPWDKITLGIGMGVTLLIVGAIIGLIGRRNYWISIGIAIALGVVVAVAIVSRADAGIVDVLPLAIGVVVGCWYLRSAFSSDAPARTFNKAGGVTDRRGFLRFAGYGVLGAAIAGGISRLIPSAAATVDSRAAVKLPPVSKQPEASVTTLDKVPGIAPYVTADSNFYRIDTAFTLPELTTAGWKLRIHGMVDNPIEINFDQLLSRPQIERMVTLTCVSNPVGGPLIGNARWQGIHIADLLAEAKPQSGADCVLSSDAKGFTVSTPLQALTDGRDAMLAVGMNGQPLPVEHGFPVRMVVPGLYGYVSATKWVVDMEVTQFAKVSAYWTRNGWSDHGPIKTSSRIDVPSGDKAISAGPFTVAGVAWAQHRGISKVQVQIDNKPWADCTLSKPVSKDTWVQWSYQWDVTPGYHTIKCRAIDGTGALQIAAEQDVIPNGATGYNEINLQATA
ncbi:MAG: molybdopterin-dependent oxidoreductase [Actinomycetota bacterium]|nr:molybdopterin-dependent oxidoreductase [Actinomycetota bacterium]